MIVIGIILRFRRTPVRRQPQSSAAAPGSKHDWEGTQHEYWNFEDEFFDKNDKAKRERIKKESKIRIEFLQNEIKRMQDELKEIECKM